MAGLTKRRIEADRGRVTTDVAGVSGLISVMCQPEFPECEPHILFIDQKVLWASSCFPAENNHGECQHGAECDTGTDGRSEHSVVRDQQVARNKQAYQTNKRTARAVTYFAASGKILA